MPQLNGTDADLRCCRQGHGAGELSMNTKLDTMPSMIDRIHHDLVDLKMPRALGALDHVVRGLEHGELSVLEAIDICCRRSSPCARTAASRRRSGWAGSPPSRPWPASTSPAVTRQGSHLHAGPARFHRARRGSPFPWPVRNRQEPPRHGARRRSRQGRKERLLLHPGRPHHLARTRRAEGRLQERIRSSAGRAC